MRGIGISVVISVLLAAAACQPLAPPRTSEIRVDIQERYQTIDGWAFLPRMWEEDKPNNRFDNSFEPYAEAVSNYLVNEVGINAVRVEIQSGMENPNNYWKDFYSGELPLREFENHRFEKHNDNDDPNLADPAGFQFQQFDWRIETMVLPVMRALEARGEKLYVNVNFTDFGASPRLLQGSLSHAENPQEYAEIVLVYFKRLRDKYNIIPDSFELILEPDNTKSWRGKNIGEALLVVNRRLRENGFEPEFIATSAASTSNSVFYFEELLTVPGAVELLDTLSYHRYGERIIDIETLQRLAKKYQLKTGMLEKLDGDIDMLMEDLLVGQVSSWQQWASTGRTIDMDKGAYYVRVNPGSSPASPEISMANQTRQLAAVFRYVRKGAVRIGSSSDNKYLKTVAFINPDDSQVVIIRNTGKAGRAIIKGLPAGRYRLRFASDENIPAEFPEPVTTSPTGELEVTVPATGVLSIF